MAPFKALYIRRSDGKPEVLSKGRRPEKNQPTDEQLDQTPDKNGVSDYYREVHITDAKHLDWRRKLGGMLARQLDAGSEKANADVGYILAALPEHYRLYEHVKKTEKDGKLEVKAKTHAAGGNDRQDAYLYGHPMGRKKRYRSPADFFPHLLWLGLDEEGDSDNCTCKICCPEDVDSLGLSSATTKVKTERAMESKPIVTQPPVAPRQPNAVAKARTEPQRRAPFHPGLPYPLPAVRTQDQSIDSHYRSFMYRPGELIWFKRGQPWGLGVITRRWTTPSKDFYYTVQPLSYPGHNPRAVTKSGDSDLRPWLAWSVPRYTSEELNNIVPPPTYDTADWQGMALQKYGAGDMEVDGSILAAKGIDATYTLFGKYKTDHPGDPAVTDTLYCGMFLGAEKIWVGEPVRLRIGSGTDILVVHHIIETQRFSSATKQVIERSVLLQGDVYCLTNTAHDNPDIPSPASPNNNPQLPLRLTQDLAVRNSRSIKQKHSASHWKFMRAQARIDISDVKGRWYEATILLPILQPGLYSEALEAGEVQEASLWMNARGDCAQAALSTDASGNQRPASTRNVVKETRLAAFGAAVPPSTVIYDGIQPPPPSPPLSPLRQQQQQQQQQPLARHKDNGNDDGDVMEVDPRFDTAESVSSEENIALTVPRRQGLQTGDGGSLDAFLDLDGGMDDVGFATGASYF